MVNAERHVGLRLAHVTGQQMTPQDKTERKEDITLKITISGGVSFAPMNAERTEIGTLGEFGLIAELTKGLECTQDSTQLGSAMTPPCSPRPPGTARW